MPIDLEILNFKVLSAANPWRLWGLGAWAGGEWMSYTRFLVDGFVNIDIKAKLT